MLTNAQKQTVQWFKNNEPFIYRVAVRKMELQNGDQLGGISDIFAGAGDIFKSITSTVTNLAPQYLQFQQQKKVMDMQLDRAKQGLPPANVADYAPVIKIEPTINADTEAAITRAAKQTAVSGLQKMLPYIAGGGLLVIYMLTKRR